MPETPIRLLYVLCKGRSGSTLAGLLLGAHPEIASLGEIVSLGKWIRSAERRTCSCEEPFLECSFWNGVRERLGDRWGVETDLDAEDDATFAHNNLQLFRAVQGESGATLLVDKSKKLGRALRLAEIPGIDLTIMHVVRDPRAVANSFRQRGVRKSETGRVKYNFYKNVARWTLLNTLMPLRLGRHAKYVRVRYEDLVQSPEEEMRRVLAVAGLDYHPAMDSFGEADQHGVGGNRMRLSGVREIRPDRGFLSQVSSPEWILGTAMALPTLLAHGYPVSRGGAAHRLEQSPQTSGE